MKKNPKDLTGTRFNRLTAIKINEELSKYEYWLCVCDCGGEKNVTRNNLLTNNVKSCGCLFKEKVSSHKMSKSRIYEIWIGIKKRCYVKECKAFENYGGRGLEVCEEWKNDFVKFRDWALENGYKENLTLDRIDNEKGYFPDNCKWSTYTQQANNKRNNVLITFKGEVLTLSQLSKRYGINAKTISNRLKSGYKDDELIAERYSLKRKRKEGNKCTVQE